MTILLLLNALKYSYWDLAFQFYNLVSKGCTSRAAIIWYIEQATDLQSSILWSEDFNKPVTTDWLRHIYIQSEYLLEHIEALMQLQMNQRVSLAEQRRVALVLTSVRKSLSNKSYTCFP